MLLAMGSGLTEGTISRQEVVVHSVTWINALETIMNSSMNNYK